MLVLLKDSGIDKGLHTRTAATCLEMVELYTGSVLQKGETGPVICKTLWIVSVHAREGVVDDFHQLYVNMYPCCLHFHHRHFPPLVNHLNLIHLLSPISELEQPPNVHNSKEELQKKTAITSYLQQNQAFLKKKVVHLPTETALVHRAYLQNPNLPINKLISDQYT